MEQKHQKFSIYLCSFRNKRERCKAWNNNLYAQTHNTHTRSIYFIKSKNFCYQKRVIKRNAYAYLWCSTLTCVCVNASMWDIFIFLFAIICGKRHQGYTVSVRVMLAIVIGHEFQRVHHSLHIWIICIYASTDKINKTKKISFILLYLLG